MVVRTKNSIYYIDTVKKEVSGGKLSRPLAYKSAFLICGMPGKIEFADGRTLTTSTILSYGD